MDSSFAALFVDTAALAAELATSPAVRARWSDESLTTVAFVGERPTADDPVTLAVARHGQAAVVRTLARPQRARASIQPF